MPRSALPVVPHTTSPTLTKFSSPSRFQSWFPQSGARMVSICGAIDGPCPPRPILVGNTGTSQLLESHPRTMRTDSGIQPMSGFDTEPARSERLAAVPVQSETGRMLGV